MATELKLVDTHAHVHFEAYRGEVGQVLRRAQQVGVTRLICIGVNTDDSRQAVELAGQYEGVWASVGIHPYDAAEAEQGISYLRELAGRRKVVAIGECGLDFYKATALPQQQERALRLQIELALELDLPLVFHIREAFEQFWPLLRDYPQARGVVHCFTGGLAELEHALTAGLHIALNGIITFTKDSGLLEAARQVPLERLVLETDCPFLSPASRRSGRNEPAAVAEVAERLAELRGQSVEELAAATTANAMTLFGLAGEPEAGQA